MKLIGTLLYSCIHDIMSGEVDEKDVVVVISQTYCLEMQDFIQVIENFFSLTANFDHEKVQLSKDIGTRLWQNGKIHQPRIFNQTYYALNKSLPSWLIVHPKNYTDNKAVIDAWEKFIVLETLLND